MLGLEPIDRTEQIATFRSDFRDHTLVFTKGLDADQALGLEVRYPDDPRRRALEAEPALASPRRSGTPQECELRKAKAMLWFRDFSGNRIELVVRPMNSGWRYFPSRDAGITGLEDVIIRSTDIDKDLSIWCGVFGAKVSDWAGEAAYLRFDDAHHRIALFPAERPGILAVEYAVENVNLLMRNYYVLQNLQIGILHGPGRRPASEQLFLTFAGPADVLFSFVSEGDGVRRRPLAAAIPGRRAKACAGGEASARSPNSAAIRRWPHAAQRTASA